MTQGRPSTTLLRSKDLQGIDRAHLLTSAQSVAFCLVTHLTLTAFFVDEQYALRAQVNARAATYAFFYFTAIPLKKV